MSVSWVINIAGFTSKTAACQQTWWLRILQIHFPCVGLLKYNLISWSIMLCWITCFVKPKVPAQQALSFCPHAWSGCMVQSFEWTACPTPVQVQLSLMWRGSNVTSSIVIERMCFCPHRSFTQHLNLTFHTWSSNKWSTFWCHKWTNIRYCETSS